MTDIRLDDAAVVVDGDLRVDAGTLTAKKLSAPDVDGHHGRFLFGVSATDVRAQVLIVTGAVRATNELPARNTASVAVEAASIALDHPSAPRTKTSPPILSLTGRPAPAEVARRPIDQPSPFPQPQQSVPVPRRLALTHEFGGGTDRLVLNQQRRYTQGVHVDGDLVVGGALSQASSAQLKRDIDTLPVDEARRAVDALRPVTFRYVTDGAGRRHAGFIAEEVAATVPDADGRHVRPLDLIAMLTAVVQDQQRAIAALEASVDALTHGGAS